MKNDRFNIRLPRIQVRHAVIGVKLISAIVFLFAAIHISLKWIDSARSRTTYQEIRQIAHSSSSPVPGALRKDKGSDLSESSSLATPDPSVVSVTEDGSHTAEPEARNPLPYFIPLEEMNSDTVGWIQIEGTRIDYPVVQAKDNEFYLDHDFKKNRSSGGAIFMDYRNGTDFLDQNTVLYGHHMKDGTMFKDLVKFQDEAFLQDHPIIHLKTKYKDTSWRIFAVYVSDTEFDYIRPEYRSDEDFKLFIDKIKAKAKLPDDWTIGKEERILTLSTCSYDFDDARMVVQAVLIKS